MKKLLVALSAILLASCQPQAPGSDYYTFETKEFQTESLPIKVVEHQSYDSLRTEYLKVPGAEPFTDDRELMAFSVYRMANGRIVSCTIHMIDPEVDYRPEFIGHELAHCLYGRFHPSQP